MVGKSDAGLFWSRGVGKRLIDAINTIMVDGKVRIRDMSSTAKISMVGDELERILS